MSFTKNPSNKNTQTKKYELLDLTVAFMALFIFFYRLILVAIPMFKEGYNEGNFRDMALSLTMLV